MEGINLRTIEDFEKEIRNNLFIELKNMRDNNQKLDMLLMSKEFDILFDTLFDIKEEKYSSLNLQMENREKLSRLVEIYSLLCELMDSIIILNRKVESVKTLKNLPFDRK